MYVSLQTSGFYHQKHGLNKRVLFLEEHNIRYISNYEPMGQLSILCNMGLSRNRVVAPHLRPLCQRNVHEVFGQLLKIFSFAYLYTYVQLHMQLYIYIY